MEPNLDYIRQLVREHDWSGSELARQMGISRAEANRFLNGKRKGGKKLIGGLLKAFPTESLETLFILPPMYPNDTTRGACESYGEYNFETSAATHPKPSVAKIVMKPVRHPSAHHIACTINEEAGTVEIIDGRNITTLYIPVGPLSLIHI